MISRNRNEAGKAHHIEQKFHPRRHDVKPQDNHTLTPEVVVRFPRQPMVALRFRMAMEPADGGFPRKCSGFGVRGGPCGHLKPSSRASVSPRNRERRLRMKKTLAVVAAVATLGVATVLSAPAEARGRGIGPGLAFGLAAGAIAAGAAGAYGPYYGPGYGYYGPRYYSPGPYAYYDGPYYRHRYYRHHYYGGW
jgi:hypothetical protein